MTSPEPMRLWGGRFGSGPAEAVARLSLSVHFDWRLAPYDIRQSRAHAGVLQRAGLLTTDEYGQVLAALDDLAAAVATGEFRPTVDDEDVHTAIERGLLERLGVLGGKLRAGRSRNDQVATDLRLYLRDHARGLALLLGDLMEALSDQAEQHLDSPSPGSSLPLVPVAAATELGFSRPTANSMDAVSDRDFVAELLFVIALAGVHLSRLGEEIVLWTTTEFGWVELDDAYATGSSIMPQKRTPTWPSWPVASPGA
jgi:argininosuccinate lyase